MIYAGKKLKAERWPAGTYKAVSRCFASRRTVVRQKLWRKRRMTFEMP